jgi:outer membrane protein TolC
VRIRLFAILSLVLAGTATLRSEAPPIDGTLPEDYLPGLRALLKTAVERSPNTITASINVALSDASRIGADAILYPQLNASTDYASNTQSSSTNTNTQSGFFYSAGVSQPIFQFGALRDSAKIGQIGLKIAERQYADAYRTLAVSIREQYMALIYKKMIMRNMEFSLKISQESLAAEQARFDSGSSSEAALGTAKMSVEQHQLDADKAEEEYLYGKRVFTRLVGIDDLDDESIPVDLPHPDYSASLADAVLAGFVGDGVESTFQSQVYQMYITQQDLSYSIAKVRLLPKISAGASIAKQNIVTGAASQVGSQSENYNVAASWAIFDGFATRSAKRLALENKRMYERQRKTYIDTTLDSMTYMRHQLGFSSRAMSIAEVQYNLIEAGVKRLSQDKVLGYASQATIDTGVLDLFADTSQRADARSDYLDRWTEFVSLAGVDPALDNISPRYVR